MRSKIILCCIFALFLTLHGFQLRMAFGQDWDLQELYKLAKAKDPGIGRADARLEVGHADKDIAWSALLPRVDASASTRQFWHSVKDYNNTNDGEGEYTGYSYNVTGRLPLFTMPSYFQLSSADAAVRSAKAGTRQAKQALILRLIDAYIKLLKARADEQLYRDELARVGKILEQAQAFLKAGTGDVIAVYEAKARIDSAAADLIKTEGQRRLAEQELTTLAGVPVSAVKDLVVTMPHGPQPAEFEWWLETMQKQSPIILQAREDLHQAEYQRKASRAAHLPTLQATGGYTVDKGSTFLPKVETSQWYAGISISVPIYSGGETSARTRRAQAGESERRYILEDTEDQGIKRLNEAFLNLQYNISLVDAYRRKYESAELQLKATRKGREIGTRSAIDLLNAEQGYAVSKRDITAALYDNTQRKLELKAAAGILDEEDLLAILTSSEAELKKSRM